MTSTPAAGPPARPLARLHDLLKASLGSPYLVGEGGAEARYAKIRWCMIFWRLLVLGQILLLLAVCPDCFFPSDKAFLVVGAALAQTALYSWFTARPAQARKWLFYGYDRIACAALMFLAGEWSLILLISFYSTTCLMSRPVLRVRDALPVNILITVSFLGAVMLNLGTEVPWARVIDYCIMFFFYGMAWVALSRIIERASALELDGHLEEQRSSFRRRLHDDLGNTLCGLHFKIQSLKGAGKSEMGHELQFIIHGYERAGRLLDRLLAGIDDIEVSLSLEDLLQKLETEFEIKVKHSGPTLGAALSPEVTSEALFIIREAVTNAAKHAGVDSMEVNLVREEGEIRVTISDRGSGFEGEPAPADASRQHHGLRNMGERAEAIKGRLEVESRPGLGTDVYLTVPVSEAVSRPHGGLASLIADDGAYLLIVRIKLLALIMTLVQVPLLEGGMWKDPLVVAVTSLIVIECLAWYILRLQIRRLLTRIPILAVTEPLFIYSLFFVSWRAQIPIMAAEPASIAVVMSAYFLGFFRNMMMVVALGLALVAGAFLAPAGQIQDMMMMEPILTFVTDHVVVAAVAGLAVEFLIGLEALRADSVERALDRQRERLTVETHRKLHDLVWNIRKDLKQFMDQRSEIPGGAHYLGEIERRSNHLKYRLREVLDSIDGHGGVAAGVMAPTRADMDDGGRRDASIRDPVFP